MKLLKKKTSKRICLEFTILNRFSGHGKKMFAKLLGPFGFFLKRKPVLSSESNQNRRLHLQRVAHLVLLAWAGFPKGGSKFKGQQRCHDVVF